LYISRKTRNEKNNKIKRKRQLRNAKKSLMSILIASILLISFANWPSGTHSWFMDDEKIQGTINNAKKDELVRIEQGDLIFEKKCQGVQPIKITNITKENGINYVVYITIGTTTYTIEPGQTIIHNERVVDGCRDFGSKEIVIIGYEGYFDHSINVDASKQKVCPPQSENGNGANNGNGNGMHCGNNDEDKVPPGQEGKKDKEIDKNKGKDGREDKQELNEEQVKVEDKEVNLDENVSEETEEQGEESQDKKTQDEVIEDEPANMNSKEEKKEIVIPEKLKEEVAPPDEVDSTENKYDVKPKENASAVINNSSTTQQKQDKKLINNDMEVSSGGE
jgi:hypothetical protein